MPQTPSHEKLAKIAKIARFNDHFRTIVYHLIISIRNSKNSCLCLSTSISELRVERIVWIVEAVANWTDVNPTSERKCGEVTAKCYDINWKIDYFDIKTGASKQSASSKDQSATNRVLSIKLQEENWYKDSTLA